MRKSILFLVIAALAATKSSAQIDTKHGCDCALGWPKECDIECGPKLLSQMSDNELRTKFKLSSESIDVVNSLKDKKNTTLSTYQAKLDPLEFEKIKYGIIKVRTKLNTIQ